MPTSVTLTAVRFADAQHGWAVGHGGVILATQDGGEQWTLLDPFAASASDGAANEAVVKLLADVGAPGARHATRTEVNGPALTRAHGARCTVAPRAHTLGRAKGRNGHYSPDFSEAARIEESLDELMTECAGAIVPSRRVQVGIDLSARSCARRADDAPLVVPSL